MRDPIVEEKSNAFRPDRTDDKPARVIFPGRHSFAGVILPVPGRAERVAPDFKFHQIGFAPQHAYEFPVRVINPEADLALERRRDETDGNRLARDVGSGGRNRRGRRCFLGAGERGGREKKGERPKSWLHS